MRDIMRVVIGVAVILAAAVLLKSEQEANALPPGYTLETAPDGVICGTGNLPAAPLKCTASGNYSAVLAENETATTVYFCGINALDGGVTYTKATTACASRCTTCTGGTSYQPDVKRGGGVTCWSAGTLDAGVKIKVQCIN